MTTEQIPSVPLTKERMAELSDGEIGALLEKANLQLKRVKRRFYFWATLPYVFLALYLMFRWTAILFIVPFIPFFILWYMFAFLGRIGFRALCANELKWRAFKCTHKVEVK